MYFSHASLIFKDLFLKYYISKQSPNCTDDDERPENVFLLNNMFTLKQFESRNF